MHDDEDGGGPAGGGKSGEHYLRRELYELVRTDPAIFEFLQAGSLDGIWYWDLENADHEWMSPRFWQVFGYDPEAKKHLASEWQDMIHPDDLKVALDNFHKHCADAHHPYDQYVRYRHKDGSTVWVRCRGIAIRDKAEKPIRMLGAHTDVTALKLAEEQVRTLAAELEAANNELEAFSYSVSHDLRAPLRAVDGFARAFEEEYGDKVDDEGRRILGILRKSTLKMGRLIDDLLAFSRMSRCAVKEQTVDMTTLAKAAFEEAATLEEGRKIECEVGTLPRALGDQAMFRQVWSNLMSNAIKYTRPRPAARIEVSGRTADGEALFSVRDNGVGFDEDYSDKLFGVFQRLHKESEFEGTGVGLALVRRIVERHGGRIWASSTLGEGATFEFALPVKGSAS